VSQRKRVAIGDQVYCENKERFLLRLVIDGKSTWRRLKSIAAREAKKEAAHLLREQSRAQAGLGADPFAETDTIRRLIRGYLAAGCPNARLEPQAKEFQERQIYLLKRPEEFFGAVAADKLRMPLVLEYAKWARKRMRYGTGNRTIDMELVALSSVYRWAVSMGHANANPLLGCRPRFHSESETRHCRDVAPESADELHRLARTFFEDPRSETLGWQLLIEALTGCRTSEILRLRMDARRIREPGFIDEKYLFIQRSKRGLDPHVHIHDDLRELIRAHHHWHSLRYPKNGWWLPGRHRELDQPINPSALCHGLARICPELGLPHRTSHGFRSYYVTTRRSQGIPDWEIAAEIGDRTADLIPKTYGGRPANYRGGNRHGWRPLDGPPAWAAMLPENTGIVTMSTLHESEQGAEKLAG
jgi:integrase